MPVVDPKKNFMEPIFAPMRVKYKDIFDMKEFYDALKEWFHEHGWAAYDGDPEQWETYYGERVGDSGAKEVWILWRLSKQAPDTQVIKYYFDLYFHCLGLSDTEVIKNGQKMKVNKGEVELEIQAFLQEKYKLDFKKEKGIKKFILKQFSELFEKMIYSTDDRKRELYREAYALNNFIKQWFKLKRYLPYEETKSFFPSKAWPSHIKEE